MPLRLDAVTNNVEDAVMAWILQTGTKECDSVFATEDKKYIHMRRKMSDCLSNEPIGQMVFTLRLNNEEKRMEILDIDIMLDNDSPSRIRFLNMREGSSAANEYYDAETVDEGSHLIIETVNRHTVTGDLIDKEREVRISMFPFQLSIYGSIEDFDRKMGFGKPVRAGGSDLYVHGFSEKFCSPGNLTGDKKDEDSNYSFVIGKIQSFRDVAVEFGESRLPFVLAEVDTALGVVPVAMGREVFDLSVIAAGSIVAMNTVVKADLAEPGVFRG